MALQYGEFLVQHFRQPRNYGTLPDPDVAYEDVNPLCGDRIRMELRVDASQTITAVRFRGDGCIISRAAASILTELIQGDTLQHVVRLPTERLLTALGTEIRPARRKCALLPLHVVQAGIVAAYALPNPPPFPIC